ncbi:MAG: hypothetical protein WCN95_09855 [bacterium]
MSWIQAKGGKGMLFIPGEQSSREKKHPCPDCFSCGWCSDDRCKVCLTEQKCRNCGKKQSKAAKQE